jgi:hypothetical protein
MQGFLNSNKQKYIFSHLAHHADITNIIDEYITILHYNEKPSGISSPGIYFYLTDNEYRAQDVFFIDDIPVLFPLSDNYTWYHVEKNSLIFNHDILKSAFFLLSGYQETITRQRDSLDRYPFHLSVQHELNITAKPIVNYYFDIIIRGIIEFCLVNNLPFKEKKPFEKPVFFLSHDVDRITKYDYYETALKILQFAGVKPGNFTRRQLVRLIPKYLFHFIFTAKDHDPYWNFHAMRKTEQKLSVRSTWYFLEKEGKHTNSRYKFTEHRIRKLIRFLQKDGCEIALHGTVQSGSNPFYMKKTLGNLQLAANNQITGIRQHMLNMKYPHTLQLQEKAGLKYDSTMGFADHEGFRNSYCFPFRPYDFEEDRMMNIWEIPLVVMDKTLFTYRRLKFSDIVPVIDDLIREVSSFGGIFSLLWHNCHFDEDEFPGITNFYTELLNRIMHNNIQSLTGEEIYKKITL